MTLFRPPVTRPLHPNDWVRPAGNFDFRVTSPFALRSDGFHGALDIGNFRSGDDVVAARDGRVIDAGYLKLPWSQPTTRYPSGNYGGLMVVIAHAGGMVSIYAHLGSYTVEAEDNVTAGQRIGAVGDTGSAVGAAHLHFGIQAREPIPGVGAHKTLYGTGLDVDPWPLITGSIPDTALPVEEEDMDIPNGRYLVRGTVGPGNRLRADPATTTGSKVIGTDIGDPKAYAVQVYQRGVKGQPYTLGGLPGDTYSWVGVFGQTWFVADPLVTDLTVVAEELPPADCSAENATIQQQAERIAVLQTQLASATSKINAAKAALV